MDLIDNNILIYAFRPDTEHHATAKHWLENQLNRGVSLRLFPTIETGFLRIVTHPNIFKPASTVTEAAAFLDVLYVQERVETCHWSQSARQQWIDLCKTMKLRGGDVNDAVLAAVALTASLQLATFDRGFKRFKGLRLHLLPDAG